MTNIILAKNISKSFNGSYLFRGINFEANNDNSLVITGQNGAGKSTLIKILIKYLSPNSGDVKFLTNDIEISKSEIHKNIFCIAPYYNLYEEFTALENILMALEFRNIKIEKEQILNILNHFGLEKQSSKIVMFFSSGMKQRLKYAIAKLINPKFLFIDEPSTNLDEAGKKIIYDFINEIQLNSCLIFATNETEELHLAKRILTLT